MDATLSTAAAAPLGDWHHVREAVRATFWLGAREVRTVLRSPAALFPNLLVPVFFFFIFIITGSLSGFAERFGLSNFEAFP